ncbi:MAG: histidinol-phosphate transaminase [Clostridiaceae bacterium]|nr:histidinol-phosphate transaminase [Eubacteriales bacterium]
MKDAHSFARRGIMELPAYTPGKPIEEVQREFGLTSVIKLASNENPLKVSPLALAAMHQELENCFLYPESSSPCVRTALAQRLSCGADNIVVANGGDQVISLICQAFLDEGDEAVVGDPSFGIYNQNILIMGARIVRVPLVNLTFDLDAILRAVTEKTKLIFFCNPNNPTSTIVPKDEVARFMARVPERCVVVFDEAYFEYADDPAYGDGMEYVRAERNVVVLRTFSKAYGLAGCRIGYAVAPGHLTQALLRVMPAFPVNRVAQAGAVAALGDTAFVEASKKLNAEGRTYLVNALGEMDMPCPQSHSNFVFTDTRMDAKLVYNELLKRGVIVRPGMQWGFPTSLRVSVGTMDENRAFIATMKEIKG